MTVQISHVGMTVSDLQTSIRFYTEGLGFEVGISFDSGDDVAMITEVGPPMQMTGQNLEKDGFRLHLMGWETPGVVGTPSTVRNQLGLTHLALVVDDLEATISRLVELGGSEVKGARTEMQKAVTIYLAVVTDPDGNRLELLQRG